MDFGYDWPWTHGHLIAGLCFLALFTASFYFRWRRWISGVFLAFTLWGLSSFWIVSTRLMANGPLDIPTSRFLESGQGTVLDLGAGSGRATVGVLAARPGARVVALDIFANNYGIGDNTPQRLLNNVKAAGFEGRAETRSGDVRKIPLDPATFDAAISSFMIDHLSGADANRAFSEIKRVLKPGGTFLLMVINRDNWVRFVFPFLHGHYFGSVPMRQRWLAKLRDAGFDVVEDGTQPGTLFVLARKPGAAATNAPKEDHPR